MAEFEELKLTVNLIDNASAGLQKIRQELGQLTTGQAASGVQKFSSMLGDMGIKTRQLAASQSILGKSIQAVGGALEEVVKSIPAFLSGGQEIAERINKLNQFARQSGAAGEQVKWLINQFQQWNLTAEDATRSVSGLQDALADLANRNSKVRRDLINSGVTQEWIDSYINAANEVERLNIVREGSERVRTRQFERLRGEGVPEQAAAAEAAARQRSFLGIFRQGPEITQIKEPLPQPTPKFLEQQEKTRRDAEEIERNNRIQTRRMLEREGRGEAFSVEVAKEVTNLREGAWKRFDEALDASSKALNSLLEKIKPYLMGPADPLADKPQIRGSLEDNNKQLAELSDEIKKLNQNLYGESGATEFSSVNRRSGGGVPSGVSNLGGSGVGGGGMYGFPTGGGANSSGDGGGSPAGIPPGRLGARDDPRGLEGFIRAEATVRGINPDVAVAVARSEGLRTFSGDRGKSGGAFQLYTGGGVGNMFQRDTGLNPLDPKNEKETIKYALDHAKKHGWGAWMGARKIGVTGYAGINRTGNAPPGGPDLKSKSVMSYVQGGGAGGVEELQGKVAKYRPLAISDDLRGILDTAGKETGLTARVTSGGQLPGRGTGSSRHDIAPGKLGAADLKLWDPKLGRYLSWDNPEDQPRMRAFGVASARLGATGIGFSGNRSYMGPGTMHVGEGRPYTALGREFSAAGVAARQQQVARVPEAMPMDYQGRWTGKADLNVNVTKAPGTDAQVGVKTDDGFSTPKMTRQTQMMPAEGGPSASGTAPLLW